MLDCFNRRALKLLHPLQDLLRFKNVQRMPSGMFQAKRWDSRTQQWVCLGTFATSDEAALWVARTTAKAAPRLTLHTTAVQAAERLSAWEAEDQWSD